MNRRLGVAVLVLFLSAGCTSSEAGPRGADALVTDETGAIVGTLLTEELVPLTVGSVSAHPADQPEAIQTRELEADGGFSLGDLVPGMYVVSADVVGFYPANQSVEVVAGEEATVQFILRQRPTNEAYVIVTSWEGFNPCGVSVIVTPANMCGDDNLSVVTNATSGGPDRTQRNYTIPHGFAAVVGETTWTGSDEASAYYYNQSMERQQANESDTAVFSSVLDVAQGHNPLRVFLIPGAQRENSTQGILAAYYGKVSEGGAFSLRYAVWWNGYYGDNFAPLSPVCNQFAVPKCTGVGVTPSFRFTHWMSIFMNDRPADIKEYSVLPDA